jgi:hypothetical protein
LGSEGFVAPWIVIVILLLDDIDDEAVVMIVITLELMVHELLETDNPKIDIAQIGDAIIKSVGMVSLMAGLLPKPCPFKKLKVKIDVAAMEVVDSESTPFELLNVVAVAVTGVVSSKYSFALLLK